jgi:anti-sigma factor RsiW
MIDELACARARQWIHRSLDGDTDEAESGALRKHVDACPACARLERDLLALQGGLRSVPAAPMPDDALHEVFARTARAATGRTTRRPLWRDWRAAVAAAAAIALAWGFWPRPEYSDAELQQAAVEARLVLKLTADALGKTRRATVEEVLEKGVSPALQRMPVKLPRSETPEERKSQT